MTTFLSPTRFIDSDHPDVVGYALESVRAMRDPIDQARALYLAVRDDFRYEFQAIEFKPETFKASEVLKSKGTFCLPKAILLAAVARAIGIPARLGFADVRNHLAPPGLLDVLGTDIFYFHGFTELKLEERWVKATPAFNIELCDRFGVKPLEFDGRHDSVFHAYDRKGRQHMEYVREHGSFEDLPFDLMTQVMAKGYPHLWGGHTFKWPVHHDG